MAWNREKKSGEGDRAERPSYLPYVVAGLAAIYFGRVAYLWASLGTPSFCTKCMIYWGSHEVRSNGMHFAERQPFSWRRY